ncbi:MAG: putative holin [Burkholderiaceae bacterium]|jgi:hypothetical protein|nr:putative holin [Burkholderiaceae bacterium]
MNKALQFISVALLRLPRTTAWLVAAVVLLAVIALVSPVQLPVALYKAALIALAGVLGYWLDRGLFPYARPDGYLVREWRGTGTAPDGIVDCPVVLNYRWVFAAALLRRAIIVGAVVIGVALGM